MQNFNLSLQQKENFLERNFLAFISNGFYANQIILNNLSTATAPDNFRLAALIIVKEGSSFTRLMHLKDGKNFEKRYFHVRGLETMLQV